MEAVIFTGLLCATWLFTKGAEPIQFLKKLLNIHEVSEPKNVYLKILRGLVNCDLCSGFWIGLLYYLIAGYNHWFLLGCIVSLAAEQFAGLYSWANSKRPL